MTVLFDFQIFTLQKYGGVSKYFAEVIRRMPKDSWRLNPLFSENEYLDFYNLVKQRSFPVKSNFKFKIPLLLELGKLSAIKEIRRGNFDVMHQTDFDPYALRHLGSKPMITTFHDANYLNGNNPRPRFLPFLSKSLRASDSIITISENSKRDLLHYYPDIPSERIHVIYHGIDTPQIHTPERVVNEDYILFVGGRERYKNFSTFAKAFSIIAPRYKGLKVVCTMRAFTPSETEMLQSLGIADRMIYMAAGEEVLNRLYRDALFFVYPSLYEGFGMPILEAMVNNCPVILSNASCFPEIAADAAVYFEPVETEDLADRMSQLLDSPDLRDNLIEKGKNRVKEFSWDKTAARHLEIYKQYSR